jgi:hypothetical protein
MSPARIPSEPATSSYLAGLTLSGVYFTDRGIEELDERRGDEQVTLGWLAERLRVFVDANPDFEDAIERLATFLARDDSDDPEDD